MDEQPVGGPMGPRWELPMVVRQHVELIGVILFVMVVAAIVAAVFN